jgi:hypothetical protein
MIGVSYISIESTDPALLQLFNLPKLYLVLAPPILRKLCKEPRAQSPFCQAGPKSPGKPVPASEVPLGAEGSVCMHFVDRQSSAWPNVQLNRRTEAYRSFFGKTSNVIRTSNLVNPGYYAGDRRKLVGL